MPYPCPYCNRIFKRNDILQKHLKSQSACEKYLKSKIQNPSPENQPTSKLTQSNPENQPKFVNKSQSKSELVQKSELNQRSQLKPIIKLKSELIQNSSEIPNKTSHVCKHCQFSFARSDALKRHLEGRCPVLKKQGLQSISIGQKQFDKFTEDMDICDCLDLLVSRMEQLKQEIKEEFGARNLQIEQLKQEVKDQKLQIEQLKQELKA